MYLIRFYHDSRWLTFSLFFRQMEVQLPIVLTWKYGNLDWCSLFCSKKLLLYPPLLSSGVAGLRGSFTLSSWTGEEVRWSTLAGVRALLGRAFGVEGLPRVDGGLGEAAGLGDVGLPLAVAGDDGRLDNGLRLEGWSCFQSSGKTHQRGLIHFSYPFRPRFKCLRMTYFFNEPDFNTWVRNRQSTQTLHHS